MRSFHLAVWFIATIGGLSACRPQQEAAVPESEASPDPLPSWHHNPTRQRILDFVAAVTDTASGQYVRPAGRIAAIDNDGTMWAEKPVYPQFRFVFARLRAMAPDHPRWKRDRLIRAGIENDVEKVFSFGGAGITKLITITHSELTAAQFEKIVRGWIRTARHPVSGRPYTDMVYQPMLELVAYLQANGFRVYLVTGGAAGFVRPWVEEVYGIPPEQVVGSRYRLSYRNQDGRGVLWIEPEMEFLNNGPNKPVGIRHLIGKRPILAVGNSDGDIQMLEYTTTGPGPRLGVLIHHTDRQREWAYDRQSLVGRLDSGLVRARQHNWLVVDMKKDWKYVFPFEKAAADSLRQAQKDSLAALP